MKKKGWVKEHTYILIHPDSEIRDMRRGGKARAISDVHPRSGSQADPIACIQERIRERIGSEKPPSASSSRSSLGRPRSSTDELGTLALETQRMEEELKQLRLANVEWSIANEVAESRGSQWRSARVVSDSSLSLSSASSSKQKTKPSQLQHSNSLLMRKSSGAKSSSVESRIHERMVNDRITSRSSSSKSRTLESSDPMMSRASMLESGPMARSSLLRSAVDDFRTMQVDSAFEASPPPSPPSVGGGALWGEYNEEEARLEFQEALAQWRNSSSYPDGDRDFDVRSSSDNNHPLSMSTSTSEYSTSDASCSASNAAILPWPSVVVVRKTYLDKMLAFRGHAQLQCPL